MFVVIVEFTVLPERVADFMPLMLENARLSLSEEPGCHQFDVCQHPDQPHEVFLYELYEDAAAFEQHKAMPHFIAFSEKTDPMVTGKAVRTYDLIPTEQP